MPDRDIYLCECKALKNHALSSFFVIAVLMSMTHAPIGDPIASVRRKVVIFQGADNGEARDGNPKS